MQKLSFKLPAAQLAEIDAAVEPGTFPNRSEYIRNALREFDPGPDDDSEDTPDWSEGTQTWNEFATGGQR